MLRLNPEEPKDLIPKCQMKNPFSSFWFQECGAMHECVVLNNWHESLELLWLPAVFSARPFLVLLLDAHKLWGVMAAAPTERFLCILIKVGSCYQLITFKTSPPKCVWVDRWRGVTMEGTKAWFSIVPCQKTLFSKLCFDRFGDPKNASPHFDFKIKLRFLPKVLE